MIASSPSDAFPRLSCGCAASPLYPYKCPGHAALDGRAALPAPPAAAGSQWYADNCCPFCWRVNPYGLACARAERCDLCGAVSCNSHSQATYQLGIICPRGVNPRTKRGREFLRSLAAISSNPAELQPAVKE